MARLFVVVLVWYEVCVFLQQTLQFCSTLLGTLKWKSHATRVICCTLETCTYSAGSAVHCQFQLNRPIKKSKRLINLNNVAIQSVLMVVDNIICLKIIFSLSILVTKTPRLFVWFFHLFRANGPIAFSQIRRRLHIYSNDVPSHESCLQPKFKIKLMEKRIYYCSRHAHTKKKHLPSRVI